MKAKRRDCRRQIFLRGSVRAKRGGPGSTWSLRKRARLARGRYFVLARSRDLAQVLERKPKRPRLVYERVR